jgi:DNA invertase Pin-like site-specific DNA recombinase
MSNRIRLRAALYLRRSNAKQEMSLFRQEEECRDFASKPFRRPDGTEVDFDIVATYAEKAVSGDELEGRPEFMRLREDAGRGLWDAVIAWDHKRLSRSDDVVFKHAIFPLYRAGTQIFTVAEGLLDLTSSYGRITSGLRAENAKDENLARARNTASGLLKAAREGRWIGKAPVGYTLDRTRGRLIPNPDRVPHVREAFTRFAGGESARSVVFDFNRRGVPGPTGGAWTENSLVRLLRRDAYLGRTVYGKVAQGRYFTVSKDGLAPRPWGAGDVATDPAGWVIRESTHEPIVDVHTWQTVQRLLTDKVVSPRGKQEPFLMTSLAVCGQCGARLTGQWRYPLAHVQCGQCGTDRWLEDRPGHPPRCKCGKTFRAKRGMAKAYFVCSGHGARGNCRHGRVLESDLWYAVADLIVEQVIDPLRRAGFEREIEKRIRDSAAPDPARLQKLTAEAASLDKRIAKGAARYISCPAHMTAAVAAEVEKLKARRSAVAEELAALQEAQAQSQDVARVVRATVQRLEVIEETLRLKAPLPPGADLEPEVFERYEAMREADRQGKRALLVQLVKKVTVRFEEVEYTAQKTGRPFTRYEPAGVEVECHPDAWTIRSLAATVLRCETAPARPWFCRTTWGR